jgi:putative hydrolase of the HAD superfamily
MTSTLVPFPAGTPLRSDELEGARPPRIRAVCLDIDDTLIDTTTSARKALFGMIGRDDLWPAWERMTDEYVDRVVAGEMDYVTMRRARTKAFFADLGALLDDDLVATLEDRRLAQMNSAWQLFDDALPCLDWLRAAGLRIAAITNASGPHQRAKLLHLGIARFFDAVVIAGEVGVSKPESLIFRSACERLDVPVCEVMHIGDRLEVDAVGARNAGLHATWLNRAGPPCGQPGVHVIETLSDLPELLVSDYLTPSVTEPSPMPLQRARFSMQPPVGLPSLSGGTDAP